MAVTLDAVRAKIARAAGGTLTLAAADLGVDAVGALFSAYLPGGVLTLAACVPGKDGLSASGSLTLGQAAAATVVILPDAAGAEVSGIAVTAALPSWKIVLPFTQVDAMALGGRGATSPRLELSAGGAGPAAAPSARIVGDLSLTVGGKAQPATIAADVPAAADPPLNYLFRAEPAGVEITGFAALGALVSGFTFIPPIGIPVAPTLELVEVEYALSPLDGTLLRLALELRSARGLDPVPGTVTIPWVGFRFLFLLPDHGGSMTALVLAPVTVRGVEVDMAAMLPELSFEGSLSPDTPIPLAPFLQKFGVSDPLFDGLQLDGLDVVLGLQTPVSYSLYLDVGGTSSISLNGVAIAIERISLSLDATGSADAAASFGGAVEIGGVPLYMMVARSDAGWRFFGGTHGGDPVELGAWIGSVAETYGYDGLPASLHSLTLSDIELEYDTGDQSRAFTFTCTGELAVSDATVDATLSVVLAETAGQPTKTLAGTLAIHTPSQELDFALAVDVDADGTTLVGTLSAAKPVGLLDLLGALGFHPDLPEGIDITLQGLGVAYRTHTDPVAGAASTFVITADAGSYGRAMVVVDRVAGAGGAAPASTYLFAASVPVTGSLADIPIVGGAIPPGLGLSLDGVQLLLASAAIPAAEMSALAGLVASLAATLPRGAAFDLPSTGIASGATLTVGYTVGGDAPTKLVLAAADDAPPASAGAGPPDPGAGPAPAPAATPAGTDGTVWISVQRQLGALQLNRIGFGYSKGVLSFALDAGATLGPLMLSLDGLSIGSPLTSFSPTFDLQGIGITYAQPPMEIGGALLKLPSGELGPGTAFQFDGSVALSFEDVGITGIGSYAQTTSGDPSLFVFAELLTALGGPPPFFVTGLMAGFGFNRALTIPAMDEVGGFPLLLLAQPPAGGAPAAPHDPGTVLQILEGEAAVSGGTPRRWIAPDPGALWIALGVQFTSFEIVTTRALLVVQPTGDLTVDLLGISDLTLPLPDDGASPFCFAEMQLRAVFQPDDGVLGASAVLSNNSYVLTPDCHLTGGFAFGAWFGANPNAGDFVLTLGGYHPAFKPPAHYPVVPRLGFSWAVSDNVSISGDAYFALTPSCAMGGGGLEVLFHDGDLQAWFTAAADLLISWRPFWFSGDIDVEMGVSYRLNLLFCHTTVSLSIGAGVEIWGPPTGGTVHVHLVVVTFDVSFGSDGAGSTDDPLTWTQLRSLLPHPASVCTVTAGSSLAKTVPSADPRTTNPQRWIARPRGFDFTTRSAVPASALACDAPSAPHGAGGDAGISIRPMYLDGVTSTHTVKVSVGDPTAAGIDLGAWSFTPRRENVPASLWGAAPADRKQTPPAPGADLVPGQLVGYAVSTPPPSLNGALGPIAYTLLTEEELPPGVSPLDTVVTLDGSYLPAPSTGTIGDVAAIGQDPASGARSALLAALQGAGAAAGLENAPMTLMARKSAHLFADPPMRQG